MTHLLTLPFQQNAVCAGHDATRWQQRPAPKAKLCFPRAPCMDQGFAEQPQVHIMELLGDGMTHKIKTHSSLVPVSWMRRRINLAVTLYPVQCFLAGGSVSFSFLLTPHLQEAREGVVSLSVLAYHAVLNTSNADPQAPPLKSIWNNDIHDNGTFSCACKKFQII